MSEEVLKIIDLTKEGQGVAKTDSGQVVFVPFAVPGDQIKGSIKQTKNNLFTVETPVLLHPSTHRIPARCPYFRTSAGKNIYSLSEARSVLPDTENDSNKFFLPDNLACGGCHVQELDYGNLADIKEKQVYQTLKRLGKLDLKKIQCLPILKAEEPWHYRNHVQLKIKYNEGSGQYSKGFFAAGSHQIVDHDCCLIAPVQEKQILKIVFEEMSNSSLAELLKTSWRELIIRTGDYTGDLLLAFSVDSLDKVEKAIDKQAAQISSSFERLAHRIHVEITDLRLKSIWLLSDANPRQDRVVWGQKYFEEQILGKRYQVYPRSFFQVNTRQAENLFQILIDLLAKYRNAADSTLFDLYSGAGVIGITLAPYFKSVQGVEIFADSVKMAGVNAKNNQVENIGFSTGKAENWLLQQDVKRTDVIVVDPPRRGLDKSLIKTLLAIKAETMIYVSCNPATLARDLKGLSEKWQIRQIRPVDLFPWTMHVETVALLSHQEVEKTIYIEYEPKDNELIPYKDATYEEIKHNYVKFK